MSGIFNNADKGGAPSGFFKKNKSLAVLLPLLVVLLVVVVIVYTNPGSNKNPSSSTVSAGDAPVISESGSETGSEAKTVAESDLSGQNVDVLPQMERVIESHITIGENTRDPFGSRSLSMVLKGIAISDENNTAIIETENRAYVVKVGDRLEDWSVEKIGTDGVVLKDRNGNEHILTKTKE